MKERERCIFWEGGVPSRRTPGRWRGSGGPCWPPRSLAPCPGKSCGEVAVISCGWDPTHLMIYLLIRERALGKEPLPSNQAPIPHRYPIPDRDPNKRPLDDGKVQRHINWVFCPASFWEIWFETLGFPEGKTNGLIQNEPINQKNPPQKRTSNEKQWHITWAKINRVFGGIQAAVILKSFRPILAWLCLNKTHDLTRRPSISSVLESLNLCYIPVFPGEK